MAKKEYQGFKVEPVREEFYISTPSEEAAICLNCPLPPSECEKWECKRFMDEKKKLKRSNGDDNLRRT